MTVRLNDMGIQNKLMMLQHADLFLNITSQDLSQNILEKFSRVKSPREQDRFLLRMLSMGQQNPLELANNLPWAEKWV